MNSGEIPGIKVPPASIQASVRPRQFRWYLALALYMTALVIVGFWSSLTSSISGEAGAKPGLIYIHAAIFFGWMGLLMAQTTLVALDKVNQHKKLGIFVAVYGIVVLLTGFIVGFASPIMHVNAGEWDIDRAAAFLIVPLGDMLLFGGFFCAAIMLRKNTETHKRLIILATVALLFPAVARMGMGLGITFLLVWMSPVIIAMGYDLLLRRIVHPAYIIGSVILLAGVSRMFLKHSEAWLTLGRAMLHVFI